MLRRNNPRASPLGKCEIEASNCRFRLYQNAVFTGFKRGQRTQLVQQALLKIEGCNDTKSSLFYHGKRVAFVYKAENKKRGTNHKCIWGKVCSSHGQAGMVKAKFARNLPPRAMGSTVRVMLYPNRTI